MFVRAENEWPAARVAADLKEGVLFRCFVSRNSCASGMPLLLSSRYEWMAFKHAGICKAKFVVVLSLSDRTEAL
jgi:hypothetical protein